MQQQHRATVESHYNVDCLACVRRSKSHDFLTEPVDGHRQCIEANAESKKKQKGIVMRPADCLRTLLALALLASILPATSHATLLYLNERDAFESALAGSEVSTITFDDFATGQNCEQPPRPATPCTLAIGDVTFVSTCGMFGCNLPPTLHIAAGWALYDSRGLVNAGIPLAPDDLYVDFSSQFIGLTLVGNGDPDQWASLVLTDSLGAQTLLSIALTPDGSTFFGAYSALGLSRLSIFSVPDEDGSRGNIFLDNVITAAKRPVTVDEPGTLALLLFSFSGLYLFPRKRPSTE